MTTRNIPDASAEALSIQVELFELLVKAARRCNYDLKHATDYVSDPEFRATLRERAVHWGTIFDPANGTKDYRSRLHHSINSLEFKLEKAIALLDSHKIDHDIEMPF